MTLTIFYRHRDPPDAANMIMIAAQENVPAMVDELQKRGYVVDKISTGSVASAVATAEPS